MPSSVWGISCFVIALLVSTAHAEYPDLMNRYQDQLRVQREENWFQQQLRMFRTYPHLDRAYRLIDSNRLSEARAELDAALAVDPRDPQARLTYMLLLHRLQAYSELIPHADRLVGAHPGFVPALLYRGLAHQALGDTDTAMADFEAAASNAAVQEPDRLFALNMIADLAIAQHRYPKALAALERFPMERRDFTWYVRQGAALEKSHRIAEAKAAYQRARSLAPGVEEQSYALRALGEIAQRHQDWESAHEAIVAALALKPQDADLLRALAVIADAQKDFPETTRRLRQLRALGKATRQDREWLAQALQTTHDYQAAAAELNSLLSGLEAPAERHRVAMALGSLYMEAGQFSDAARAFADAAHTSRDLPTLAALAQAYAQSGQWPQTLAILKETLQTPQHAEQHLQLGILAVQAGDEATALQHLELALSGPLPATGKVLAHKQQAYLHHNARRYAQADQAFAEALALQPQDPDLLRAAAETGYARKALTDTARRLQQLSALGQATPQDRERLAQVFHMLHQDQQAIAQYRRLRTELPASADRHRVSMALGHLYFGVGQFRDAAAAFKDAARLHPDLPTWLALAQTYERTGELAAAITALQKALPFDRTGEISFKLGVLYHQIGREHEALRHLNVALQGTLSSGKKAEAYRQQGLLYHQLGRYAEAREALEQAVVISPQDPALYAALGQTCLQLAAIPEAIAALQRSAALQETPTTLHSLALAYTRAQQWQDAADTTRRLLTFKERSAFQRGETFANLGVLYSHLGQDTQAADAFREAIALGHESARFQFGFSLAKLGQWTEALTQFRLVHSQHPTSQSALAMGRTYAALGKTGLALPYFKEALQHKDELIKADQLQLYTAMGALYAEEADYPHAAEAWAQALTLGAPSEVALSLGRSRRLSGQLAAAERTLAAIATETWPPSLQAERLDELAALYAQTGRVEKVITTLNQATALQPTADRHFRIGQAYQTVHRLNEALRHFQTAVTLDPHHEHYTLALAYAYKTTQQSDAARRLFETALERAPENVSLYKELAYLHLRQGRNDEAVRRFRQGIDQALKDLQLAKGDTRIAALNSDQRRSRTTSAASAAAHPPPMRLEGTFLQLLRRHGEWHPQDWANLFRYFKELQLSYVIIQWTVYDGVAFYPTTADHQVPNAPLDTILRLADEAGIRVYVGLVAESQYWAHIRQPLPQVEKYLRRLRSHAVSVARQLLPIVARHPSFQGWYISEEIDDTTWRTLDFRAVLSAHLHRLSTHLHDLTPTKSVALSGFANGRLDPQAFENFWSGLLQDAAIDVVLFQDGIGVRKLELPELSSYLMAIRNATQAHHRELKVILEIFDQVAGPPLDNHPFRAIPAGLERIRRQIELSAAYASSLVAFSIPEYMTPLGGAAAEGLFDQYRAWFVHP
jgi:tetratricopeptide (TPR) repeat protein